MHFFCLGAGDDLLSDIAASVRFHRSGVENLAARRELFARA